MFFFIFMFIYDILKRTEEVKTNKATRIKRKSHLTRGKKTNRMPQLSRLSSPLPYMSIQEREHFEGIEQPTFINSLISSLCKLMAIEVSISSQSHLTKSRIFYKTKCLDVLILFFFFGFNFSFLFHRLGLRMKVVRIKGSHIRRTLQSMSHRSTWMILGYFIGN